MSFKVIPFIEISYDELRSMPVKELEIKISQNLKKYLDGISNMSIQEMMEMREDVKETRKQKFRFSQDITSEIPKDRIQIALTNLAKLFRKLDERIRFKEIFRCHNP